MKIIKLAVIMLSLVVSFGLLSAYAEEEKPTGKPIYPDEIIMVINQALEK